MLRVFLSLKQINLHIRQPVLVEINIRKKDKTITVPNQFPMFKGKSQQMNVSFEFHMTEKNPVFQICVVLCLAGKKKLAGWKEVNLRRIRKQQTLHIQEGLQSCPDKNALIKFQMTYMDSTYDIQGTELISEQQIHQMNTMLKLSEIEQQRRIAQNQNRQLEKQYKTLIEQNLQLNKKIQAIEQHQAEIEAALKHELAIQQNRHNECLTKLEQEKYKMAQILDLLLETGDMKLIDMIQEQISQMNDETCNMVHREQDSHDL